MTFTHGHTRGRRETRVHKSWSGMMGRCYTVTNKRYEDWGGRGIRVCDRWHTFENFLADMGAPPVGMSIERINNDGDYEPGNCKWATAEEQGKNKRPYRAKHRCKCQICESDFMGIMPRASTCSEACRKEYNRRCAAKSRQHA